ncbi:MAG: hypothetical protein WKG07_34185 [Hymenobacter sp.]
MARAFETIRPIKVTTGRAAGRGGAGPGCCWAWPALLLAGACSPLRLLAPQQRLLTKVAVESEGLSPAQQERMLTLAQQKPNRRLPIPQAGRVPARPRFYDSARIERKIAGIKQRYANKLAAAQGDSARTGKLLASRDRHVARKRQALDKGNAVMRLGEPPVIYDPSLSQRTVDQLTTYLHAQGFFRAQRAATPIRPAPSPA